MKRNLQRLSHPREILAVFRQLRDEVEQEGRATYERWRPAIVRRDFQDSARNLACYTALRRRDLSGLQTALLSWGLAPLAHAESQVLSQLAATIAALDGLCGGTPDIPANHKPFSYGERLLSRQNDLLFGKPRSRRRARIMVTLATEAATDFSLIRDLVDQGMDCARINCAHDGPGVWEAMIANVRRAVQESGSNCRILMDLAGPKPRTDITLSADHKGRLFQGSYLLLTSSEPQTRHDMRFQASCTMPEIIPLLKPGAEVWIDEGRIGTKVAAITDEGALLKVTKVRANGEKLRPGKGINMPDTLFERPPFTAKDRSDIAFITNHADILGYSFVQEPTDITLLYQEMESFQGEERRCRAVVLKIETRRAVQNLPELIAAAGGQWPTGVMIARGDLGVEIGFKELSEVQEHILALGAAARVPVIWATQVLEKYVKKGVISRADMTDAIMGGRAECVMLNKGGFLREAVSLLDDILRRSRAARVKNLPTMPPLSWLR